MESIPFPSQPDMHRRAAPLAQCKAWAAPLPAPAAAIAEPYTAIPRAPRSWKLAMLTATLTLAVSAGMVAPQAASAQNPTIVIVPRGGRAPLALQAPANARCELTAAGSRGAHALTAFSDARGIVRYLVGVRPDARTGVLATLDCRGARAHTLASITLAPGALAPRPPIGRLARRPVLADLATTARYGVLPGTPAAFDVTTARDAELAQLHYPRRPDARHNPTGYAIWRKLVTTPGAYVAPALIVDPKKHGPVAHALVRPARRSFAGTANGSTNFSVGTSPNWGGAVINGQPSPFSSVWASWVVPAVSTDGNLGPSFSSAWVGMDGFGTNDVLQDGTEQDATDDFFFTFTSYYAWYEFYPDQSYAFSNVVVSPGDSVFAQSSAFIYPNGTVEGDYLIYDSTSNTGTVASEIAPAGTVFTGASAEWIVERPTVNGGLWPMPDYDSAQMTSTAATSTDGTFYFADGSNNNGANDNQFNLFMTSDGAWTGDILSNGYAEDATDVGFHYFNWL